MPNPSTPQPSYFPGVVPEPARVEMSVFDTITESLFGDASAEGKWRPLTVGNFFSEGWLEPWAGGPAGQSGLTPRHGWLGAFEGVFYRLWLVDGIYQNHLNKPYGGNSYRGDFGIFLPFSRRFEMYLNVPYVVATGPSPHRGYRSDFGDMSIAGSFLLSESKAFTQLLTLGTIVPTGRTGTEGNLMTVFPRYSFWSNPGGAWVVRGGTGVNVPLNKNDQRPPRCSRPEAGRCSVSRPLRPRTTPPWRSAATSRLTTCHSATSCSMPTATSSSRSRMAVCRPTSGSAPARDSRSLATGGLLHYWEFPLVGPQAFDFQMSTAMVKRGNSLPWPCRLIAARDRSAPPGVCVF